MGLCLNSDATVSGHVTGASYSTSLSVASASVGKNNGHLSGVL